MGRGGGGCYTGRDAATGELTARRNLFQKMKEPRYSMAKVPACNSHLEGAVVLKPPSREAWFTCVPEMLLLCNEAQRRFLRKNPVKTKVESESMQAKPLGLEYIADRVDTDDPIKGYLVRTEAEGWLQGFITYTTFTTWHQDFQWNSLVQEAGISDAEKRSHVWDYDNSLAKALQSIPHSGNPKQEGIVWKRLAEVSLLGAVGCGKQLLQALIEELESEGEYDYLVLQATENAIGFYERMGFIRVGAVAKPDQEFLSRQAEAQERRRQAKAEELEGRKRDKLKRREEREAATMQLMQARNEGWRGLCLQLLDEMLASHEAERLLHAPPGSPMQDGQLCVDLASVKEALEEEDEWGGVGGGGGELDPTAWAKEVDAVRYADAEEFARDVCMVLKGALQWGGGKAAPASRAVSEFFKVALNEYGDGEAVKGGTDGSKFYLYVDLEWRSVRGFRLFELFGEAKATGNSKTKVAKAREWLASKELEPRGGYPADKFSFVPKTPKPKSMQWMARRSIDGQLQTAVLPVSVVHLQRKREGLAGVEYIEVLDQGKKVTAAYTKLLAIRGLSNPVPGGASGGKEEEEGGEEVSEYERRRLERMKENQRLLDAVGLTPAVANGAAERGDRGESKVGRRRRKREEGEEGERRERKVTRSRLGAAAESGVGGREGAADWTADMSPMKDSPMKGEALGGRNGSRSGEEAEEAEEGGDSPRVRGGGLEALPESRLHACKEGETPRSVAARYGVDLERLIQLNKGEVPGLWAKAKLAGKTVLKLPRKGEEAVFTPMEQLPHAPKGWAAYCHWTYPDQDMDELYPSYMMARKLGRGAGGERGEESALAKVQRRLSDVPPTIKSALQLQAQMQSAVPPPGPPQDNGRKRGRGDAPVGGVDGGASEWPRDGVYRCREDERVKDVAARFGVSAEWMVAMNLDLYSQLNKTVPLKAGTTLRLPDPEAGLGESSVPPPWLEPCLQILSKLKNSRYSWPFLLPVDWEALGLKDYPFICPHPMDLGTVRRKLVTGRYQSANEMAADVKLTWDNALTFNPAADEIHKHALKMQALFESEWKAYRLATSGGDEAAVRKAAKNTAMYNKVVRLEEEAGLDRFYFVLHYVPDMHWCHLVPMHQEGVFPATLKHGSPHPNAGRPRWKLMPEGAGEELDCSAERCVVVKSITVNKTSDADKEAWDILEGKGSGGDGGHVSVHGQAGGVGGAGRPSGQGGNRKGGGGGGGGKGGGRPQGGGRGGGGGGGGGREGGEGRQRGQAEEEEWVEECIKVWKKLVKHEKAWPFMEPVDADALNLPDYHTIITEPMDLSMVGRRLEQREYASAERFVREVELTFENAMTYNPDTNFVYKYAAAVKAQFHALCAQSALLAAIVSGGGARASGKGGGGAEKRKSGGGGGSSKPEVAKEEYVAAENETPRIIARRAGVDLEALLELNQQRFPGLLPSSKFKKGTSLVMPVPLPERSPSPSPASKYQRQTSPVFQNPPPQPTKPPPVPPAKPPPGLAGGGLAAGFAANLGMSDGRGKGRAAEAGVELSKAGARTLACKVVDSLLKRVEDSESGRTLKITSVVPAKEVAALLKALGKNRSTTRLDLEGCGIGDEGAKRLDGLLRKQTVLEELDLQFNQITDEGAEALAGGIAASRIRQVHIGNNDLTERGARALVDAVERRQSKTGESIDLLGVSHLLDGGAGERGRGRSPVRERSGSPVRRS